MAKGSVIAFRAFLALLYAGILVVLVMLAPKFRTLFQSWQQGRAGEAIAAHVLEDPINQYDSVLGWKHIPGKAVDMDDAFPGRGIEFRINDNGFRSNENYTNETPEGMQRIVAVGDSFTFGNVKWRNTWTEKLERLISNLQVINMGASAYGIDQMFLWYREDGQAFDADMVVAAVIPQDFRRVFLHKWVSGHGKPRFIVEDGKLQLLNVPVPKRIKPGEKNKHPLDDELAGREDNKRPTEETRDDYVPFRILAKFNELVGQSGTRFLVLYLPISSDLDSDLWYREELGLFCRKWGIEFLDLTTFFRKALKYEGDNPAARVARAFRNATAAARETGIFLPDGHYNKDGNQLVAEGLARYLAATQS